jgi:hypothetical protein
MKRVALVLVASLVLAGGSVVPAVAGPPSIGLYFDPDCAACGIQVQTPGLPFDLYVNAALGAGLWEGTTGAEFRIEGMPSDWWILEVRPNPAASIFVGEPLGWGCNIAFDECQGPPGGCINLLVIRVLPVSDQTDVHLQVRDHVAGPNCGPFCCPILTACDSVFTHVCAANGEAWINGPDCTVRTGSSNWSSVKKLYR